MMTRILMVVGVLLFAVAALGQEAAKLVYVPGKQIEEDIRKARANMGEQEINLIERTPDHAGILLAAYAAGEGRGTYDRDGRLVCDRWRMCAGDGGNGD